MLANRVLMGSAVLVLVAVTLVQGAAAGAPPIPPGQAPGPVHCLALVRQELGTYLSGISAAAEEKLCNDLELPTTGSMPTTGGTGTHCAARVRQQLGTYLPSMSAADESKLCNALAQPAATAPTTGGMCGTAVCPDVRRDTQPATG